MVARSASNLSVTYVDLEKPHQHGQIIMVLDYDLLCHVLATVRTHPSILNAVIAWLLDLYDLDATPLVNIQAKHATWQNNLLWLRNDGALSDQPSLQTALYT